LQQPQGGAAPNKPEPAPPIVSDSVLSVIPSAPQSLADLEKFERTRSLPAKETPAFSPPAVDPGDGVAVADSQQTGARRYAGIALKGDKNGQLFLLRPTEPPTALTGSGFAAAPDSGLGGRDQHQ